MAVENGAGGDKGGILAQTRRVRWVLATMTITLLVSWPCFLFLFHLHEKHSDTGRFMDQVTTAYTLANIA